MKKSGNPGRPGNGSLGMNSLLVTGCFVQVHMRCIRHFFNNVIYLTCTAGPLAEQTVHQQTLAELTVY